MKPAVFLDRDGTINEDVGHLADPDGLEMIPGAPEAIARLKLRSRAAQPETSQQVNYVPTHFASPLTSRAVDESAGGGRVEGWRGGP